MTNFMPFKVAWTMARTISGRLAIIVSEATIAWAVVGM